MLELVPDEPELVAGLEVVAGRGLAVPRRAAGEEVVVRVLDRRPGREDAGGEVKRANPGYKSAAAASNASKSGNSEVP